MVLCGGDFSFPPSDHTKYNQDQNCYTEQQEQGKRQVDDNG